MRGSGASPMNTAADRGFGDEAARALGFGLVWAVIAAVRTHASWVEGLAAWGSCSLTLGIATAIRRLPPLSATARGVLAGALFATGWLGLFGALLQTKTHNRSLGAVTFAVVAIAVLAVAALIGVRLFELSHENGLAGRAALTALLALSAVSLAVLGSSFLTAFSRGAPAEARSVAIDVAVGASAVIATLAAPRFRTSRGAARVLMAAWVLLVAGGTLVLHQSGVARAALSAGAPAAYGVLFFVLPRV